MAPLTPATVSRALFGLALTVNLAASAHAGAGAPAASKESVRSTAGDRVTDTAVGGPSAGARAAEAMVRAAY
jgi:hypothetical protein